MSRTVLDASALLAFINDEDGKKTVKQYLQSSVMSTVNISEVISCLTRIGVPLHDAYQLTVSLISEIIPFDKQHALLTAHIVEQSKQHGLSLGDRSCLSLAIKEKLPVLTADKIWKKLNMDCEIILIR